MATASHRPASVRRATPFFDQPMTRIRLRGRVLHPYWRYRFHSFGERSVVHKPVYLRGAHAIAVGRDCVILAPQFTVWRRAWGGAEPALRLGDRVTVRPFVSIGAAESLTIEDDVTIASLCLILDGDHDFAGPVVQVGMSPPTRSKPVRIGTGTAIGERVAVLPGSSIGAHCRVRANSVVQGRIPEHSIVAGFPARVVGDAREQPNGSARQETRPASR